MKRMSLRAMTDGQITNHLYQQALKTLRFADPILSRFHVGAAALVRGRRGGLRVVMGKNSEYRHRDAIHAEENVAANMKPGEKILRLVTVGQNQLPLAPCGGCREVLLTKAADGAEVLVRRGSGSDELVPLQDLLPNTYDLVEDESYLVLNGNSYRLYQMALRQTQSQMYNPYTGLVRAAAVTTSAGAKFAASGVEYADYHHSHAVAIALGMAHASRQIEIAGALYLHDQETGPIFPCGKCRQKLFESSQVAEVDFSVVSATVDGQLWYSTAQKLLPDSFGPRDLGIDVARYLDLVNKD